MKHFHHLHHGLPRLAWASCIDHVRGDVRTIHGNDVEAGQEYLVEGVWDGSFEEFGFHDTRAFFGSGLRIVGEDVYLLFQ